LSNLAISLRDVGRFEEALTSAQRAEEIRRELARRQPDAYNSRWANSLGVAAEACLAVKDSAHAVEFAQTAVYLLRADCFPYPNVHRDWRAWCQRVLAEALLAKGDVVPALNEARQAGQTWEETWQSRPGYEPAQYGRALLVRAQCEAMVKHQEAALKTAHNGLSGLERHSNTERSDLRKITRELSDLIRELDPNKGREPDIST
jgi:tetratricopeptide (TPR) repeat protein